MAFASEEIIGYFNQVKYPYNLNALTQRFVSEQLDYASRKDEWVAELLTRRTALAERLKAVPWIRNVYPSEANFLLVKVPDADALYRALAERGIVVRNRNAVALCAGCLRITVGTRTENETLIRVLSDLSFEQCRTA
jgi:histidinol-phosphate aminotransferase